MCAVELKLVQDLGCLALKTGPSLVVKNWSKCFHCFPIFIVFWGIFEDTNSVTLCQNSVFAKFWGCQK